MRPVLKCLVMIAVLFGYNSQAATAPATHFSMHRFTDSGFMQSAVALKPAKKPGVIRKWQAKWLQNRLQHFMKRAHAGVEPQKNRLAKTSLILGIIAIVTSFIPCVGLIAILSGPAALVTGIIALSKRYNNDKASRTKATIGIVLGSIVIFFTIVAIIIIASGGLTFF